MSHKDWLDFRMLYELQFKPSVVSVDDVPVAQHPLPARIDRMVKLYEEEFKIAIKALQDDGDRLPEVASTMNIPVPSRADWVYNALMYAPETFKKKTFFDLGTSGMPHVMAAAKETGYFEEVMGAEYFPALAAQSRRRMGRLYPDFVDTDLITVDFLGLGFGEDRPDILFFYFPAGYEDLQVVLENVAPEKIMLHSFNQEGLEKVMLREGYTPVRYVDFQQKLVRDDYMGVNQGDDLIVVPKNMMSSGREDLNLCVSFYERS